MAKIYATVHPEISEREIRHQDKVRKLTPEGMVLLENNGILPLKDEKKIALYGTGARKTIKGGTGSGDVNSRKIITIEQGMENAGVRITTKKWLDGYDKIYQEGYWNYIKDARAKIATGTHIVDILFGYPFQIPEHQPITAEDIKISDTDTAIYVISRNSGEGTDRSNTKGDYQLSDRELESLCFLEQYYKNTVVLFNVGGAIEIKELKKIKGISAILLVSQPGNISGDVIADVLFGKAYPSGKLTTTWANTYKDYPFGEEFSQNNGDLNDSYYKEGIYVGYRYFDTFGIEPAYPFGYGLGYAKFRLESPVVTADEKKVKILLKVVNETETCFNFTKGKEVVQVYLSKPEGKLEKPYQELVAFEKTKELDAGEVQELSIEFPTERLASYDTDRACWCIEAGDYLIRVGNSSRNTKIAAKLRLNREVIIEQDKNLFALDTEFYELRKQKDTISFHYETEYKEIQNAPVLTLDADRFVTRNISYQEKHQEMGKAIKKESSFSDRDERVRNKNTERKEKKETEKRIKLTDVIAERATLEELVAQMTKEEMAMLCVGRGWENKMDGDTEIGSASLAVPGAAGDTTVYLMQTREIRNIILADGPAGLRLKSEFQVDAEGNPISTGIALPMYADLMGKEKKETKPLEEAKTYYQYATAVPIATMLAQTWNKELLEQIGDIIGAEMEEFGITLWLAPGMNLHRNVLCGRNFEYFSEDPLLSGFCAVSETKGVQHHKGTGVTIKHFALNNQENNRNFNNSHVKERTLREIYLKSFEICVKEAAPMAVMTSYNLLNGIHTANSVDLLMSLLRSEWGFDGLVMTDWGTTGNSVSGLAEKGKAYGTSTAPGCMLAGNDLIMPGMKRDIEEILAAVGTEISLADLQAATMNILKTIMKSGRYKEMKEKRMI